MPPLQPPPSSTPPPLPPTARLLRMLVISMAILIAVGLVVIFTTIASRSLNRQNPAPEFTLPLPAGAEIRSVDVTDQAILLYLHLPEGTQKLLMIDPQTGLIKSDIYLKPAP